MSDVVDSFSQRQSDTEGQNVQIFWIRKFFVHGYNGQSRANIPAQLLIRLELSTFDGGSTGSLLQTSAKRDGQSGERFEVRLDSIIIFLFSNRCKAMYQYVIDATKLSRQLTRLIRLMENGECLAKSTQASLHPIDNRRRLYQLWLVYHARRSRFQAMCHMWDGLTRNRSIETGVFIPT